MKKTFFISFLSTIFCINVFSQTYNHCQGDSVHLGIASYTGSLQWQQSNDSLNWSDLVGATFSPYGFVFSTPKYYRAKISAPNCNPVYSPIKKTVSNTNCLPTFPQGSIFCSGPAAIVEVTNSATGKIWMDRNLGASQIATNSNNTSAYGDLYQWGRSSDGHQCRNSATTSNLSTSDQPGNVDFITTSVTPDDWRNPQNTNLWQGVNGINNPCPTSYRLPTETEWEAERLSWSSSSSVGAFSSPLKLTMGGFRDASSGIIFSAGSAGLYYSSTITGQFSRNLTFDNSSANISTQSSSRGNGLSVRCLKEPGSVNSLGCTNAVQNAILFAGQTATNVSVSVPYTGGNGGYYLSQTFSSSGVTGLFVNLSGGNFSSGSGNIILTVSGTPSIIGTASFLLNLGGQSCTLNLMVYPAQPAYPVGSVFCGGNPTLVNEITNPTTGKKWMDRNLGAAQAAASSGDVNSYGYLYQWGRGNDGHQCRTSSTANTLSSSDQPGNGSFILAPTAPNDWRSPQNTNLWQGVSGANNPCPSGFRLPTEAEFNTEKTSWSSQNTSGAFNSSLKLTLGGLRNENTGVISGVGSSGNYWTSTVSSNIIDSRQIFVNNSFALNIDGYRAGGRSVRCIKQEGTIDSLACDSITISGNLINGQVASGVSIIIDYTEGDGGYYTAQSVSSTGVTGLTATLAGGNYVNGAGSLNYIVTGTPNSTNTASFAFSIGGQTCTFAATIYPAQPAYSSGSVFCNGAPTLVLEVTNPTTGKIWMDRNLGASRAAMSSNDSLAFGDLYQWGRRSDGHQCRNSITTSALSSLDQPTHGDFILSSGSVGYVPYADWRSPGNTNLWQGVNGLNNPCPVGFRIPSQFELNAELVSWTSSNSAGAISSALKFPTSGYRDLYSGIFGNDYGGYWSTTLDADEALWLFIRFDTSNGNASSRAQGLSVRCIKN